MGAAAMRAQERSQHLVIARAKETGGKALTRHESRL